MSVPGEAASKGWPTLSKASARAVIRRVARRVLVVYGTGMKIDDALVSENVDVKTIGMDTFVYFTKAPSFYPMDTCTRRFIDRAR